MEERFIRVERTARFHVLGNIRTCRELWVVVHGYGQLGRYFLNNFTGMEEGRCIVAPEGLSRFYLDAEHSRVGATWMTREDRLHEIEDHIAYLDRLTATLLRDAPTGTTVNVLGFSQGVATVARWALKGGTSIKRLVLWAGSLPAELDREMLSTWRNIHVDLVLGDGDVYAGPEVLQHMAQRMATSGVPHRTHLFTGGHKLEPILLKRLLTASE